MRLEKNSYDCWREAYEKLQECNDDVIEVSVNSEDIDSESIINLRYFFPLALYFLRIRKPVNSMPLSMTLNIKLPKNMSEGDRKRLMSFFAQIPKVSGIIIRIEGGQIDNIPWQASRIFPLCWVRQEDGKLNYQVLNKCLYDAEECSNKADQKADLYAKLANELLRYIRNSDCYKGTTGNNIKTTDKNALQQEVYKYLNKHLGHMSILAQIIWLYILRELIEMKELYVVSEKGGERPHIHHSIMMKSRLDAVSYAESMYQLIENACVHSFGHQAWFGFRMHRAGKNGTMGTLLKETATRNMLYKDYEKCFSKFDDKGVLHHNGENIFNKDYRLFFEFFVLDDASDQVGMIENYNQKIDFEKEEELKELKCIDDLFKIKVREKNPADHIEDIATHYGLRLLRKIISVNNGYLVGKTPYVEWKSDGESERQVQTQCYFDGNQEQPITEKEDSFVTEWKAVLPIEYKWPELLADSNVINGKNCFGESIEPPRSQLYYLNWEKLSQGLVQTTKEKKILTLYQNIQRSISKLSKKKLEDAVILLQPDSSDINSLELFSKALFAKIAAINFGREDPVALRIGILFDHKDAIFEFIRLFSAFYPEGKQSEMRNVQIALCEKNELDSGIDDVAVMLAGERLNNTYSYAHLFAYHHAGNTLEYLPLLEYLTTDRNQVKQGNQEPEDIDLFPFDLCLPAKVESQENQPLDWQHNWFFRRMKHILNTNIQDKDYGCLINDIHIRLGSKLHLNCFYEAELLFHNMGNVTRFAYMIAQELLYGKQKLIADQRVLLLGYEKYSSMLLMQVEYWIKKSSQFSEVNAAVVYDSEDEKEVKVRPYFDQWQDVHGKLGSVQIVTIVPIGTTLSTVYKMQNVSRIQLQKYFGNQWTERSASRNFCLILVNEDLCTGSLSKITKRYWENVEWESHLVTLTRQRKEEEKIWVRYFIEVEAAWNDPQDCRICSNVGTDVRPIIDGKHSNTMPGAIFSLWGEHAGTFSKLVGDVKGNRERIHALYGNVFYSHIYSGNNHFQFYIDFKKLYEENKTAIDLFLRTKRVKQNAFHVIVSPLQLTNSTFVKAVIDNAFEGNARFLYMNITDAYREEIRAKFSYLTQEFQRLRYTNPKAKFAFHFVDTSIVTGNQLNRARLLIEMLLNQSNLDYSDVSLFDTVFLLVNRCSYDTANYFVQEPGKNMCAYIHLAIPSYNTENDFCPACKMVTKFQLLGKRSSSERLSREFLRLQEKHKKRTFEEYQDWTTGSNLCSEVLNRGEEDGVVLTSSAYLGWLKQWLYVSGAMTDKNPGRLWSFVPEEAKAHGHDWETAELKKAKTIRKGIEAYSKKVWKSEKINWGQPADEEQFGHREEYLYGLLETNINDVAKYIIDEKEKADFLSSAKSIIKTQLLGVRDYMRLEALQKSYESLEDKQFECGSMKAANYRTVIIDLMGKEILSGNAPKVRISWPGLRGVEKDRFLLTYNTEWLISYIKVLSRAQIVNYYEYRQAIVGVMSDMLRVLYRKDLYDEFVKKVREKKIKGDASENWEKIVRLLGNLREYDGAQEEHQLCAKLCYQVHMTLVHRMSDLQISSRVNGDNVLAFMRFYSEILDRYFQSEPRDGVPYIDMPSASKNIIRYLKAAKSATMTSNDDIPCLILAATPYELEKELNNPQKRQTVGEKRNLTSAAQYIYLENTRMLYTGMADIKEKISAEILTEMESDRPADSFAQYMEKLSQEVEQCLSSCYENLDQEPNVEDLLYQNPLSNFCRFLHQSTGEAPVGRTGEINPIAYMLRYFIRLEELSNESGKKLDNDELPYYYEELGRILCGITGFQMCYFTYCHAGNYPEIFAQSGYYVNFMMNRMLLTSVRMDEIIRLAQDEENELLPGISRVVPEETAEESKGKRFGYLVLFIPVIDDMESRDGFYVVFQTDDSELLLGDKHLELNWKVLRKARDVLFLRRRLQEVLSRDYTILINYRFDCSYVRPISKEAEGHPAAMHISDLHIQKDMSTQSPNICKKIQEALEKCGEPDHPAGIDLLIISGDIVDSREANAPRMEQNYGHAERLLNDIVSTLWKDESGYLPHDWRRRIIVSTGNHDYASMNQYQAAQKERVLTSALPTEGESGTMSKFAYFIEFLIRYLDVPVDQLLYNDLNEIRSYHNLNLKILLLNCSGKATPRRTNKMGINEDKVAKLLDRDVWKSNVGKLYAENGEIVRREPFCVVIGHYSPEYELSYFLDKYDVLPGWVWEPGDEDRAGSRPMNYLVQVFQRAVQQELEYRVLETNTDKAQLDEKRDVIRKKFQNEFRNLNLAMKLLENMEKTSPGGTVDNYYKRLNYVAVDMLKGKKNEEEAAKEVALRMRKNKLYLQLEKYDNWLNKVNNENNGVKEWSEEISRLFYEIDESIRMAEQDKKLFEDFIKHRVKNKDLYLSGHIHAYAEDETKCILVADKLLDDSREEMHGYIIQNMVKGAEPGKSMYQHSRFGVEPTR